MEDKSKVKEPNTCFICKTEIEKKEKICQNCKDKIVVKPWTRWLARGFDFYLVGIIVFIPLFIIFPELASVEGKTFEFMSIFIYFLTEPIMLTIWGTTPGKFLMNIQLKPLYQSKFTFGLALKRSFLLWMHGFWFGLPGITLIPFCYWYYKLESEKITIWDRKSKVMVIHQKANPFKVTIAITFFVIANIAFLWIAILS